MTSPNDLSKKLEDLELRLEDEADEQARIRLRRQIHVTRRKLNHSKEVGASFGAGGSGKKEAPQNLVKTLLIKRGIILQELCNSGRLTIDG